MNQTTEQERYERVLRWMVTNLEVASAVYHTAEGVLKVAPTVRVATDGRAIRSDGPPPLDVDDWQLTSAAALVACCYIDALGKVLCKHTKAQPAPHPLRFKAFIAAHMPDFTQECAAKGGEHSVDILYTRYRCGFAHQFAERDAHWGRDGRDRPYWYVRSSHPALNVDRFLCGVIAGIHDFQAKFLVDPSNGPDPYVNFSKWLVGA